VRSGRSRSSKVVDFGTNRKRVCNFLLVTPALFHPNFGVFLNYIVDVGVPKLIVRTIIFEVIQPIRPRYINDQCHGRTDGRTIRSQYRALHVYRAVKIDLVWLSYERRKVGLLRQSVDQGECRYDISSVISQHRIY